MKYELAVKLKNAGFPQEKCSIKAMTMEDGLHLGFPTLSELIEACGNDFGNLVKIEDPNCPWKWEAWLPSFHLLRAKVCKGDTPEEAVAALYLSLNSDNIIYENSL